MPAISPSQHTGYCCNISDRTSVDTLAQIASVETTAFADTTMLANTAYAYRVSVVNTSGLEVPSEEGRTPGYAIAPVNLLSAAYDPQTGGMVVRWSQFEGSRFQAYRVQRISANKLDEVIDGAGRPCRYAWCVMDEDKLVMSA